jgi:hypothetical protein
MRLRIAILAALVLAIMPATAEAKIWFDDLGGRTVEPWALVRTSIAGCQESLGCIPGIAGTPAYAVPTSKPRPRTCRAARRYHRAGRVTDRGVLRFRAPDRVGRYSLVIAYMDGDFCRPMPASAAFRVAARSALEAFTPRARSEHRAHALPRFRPQRP